LRLGVFAFLAFRYLPSQKHTELLAFLDSRKPRGAVLIDGKKMAVTCRYPFPNEKLWMAKTLESF